MTSVQSMGIRDDLEIYRRAAKNGPLNTRIYAHYIQKLRQDGESVLEDGDIEEALTAASAIGDDRIQKQSQGQVVPDSFTHGTSAQAYALV